METHDNDTPLDRIARMEAEITSALAERDLASDADERSDGHHHPAEAATDAEQRERQLEDTLRMRQQLERLARARAAIAAGTYGICVDCGVADSGGPAAGHTRRGALRVLPEPRRAAALGRRRGAAIGRAPSVAAAALGDARPRVDRRGRQPGEDEPA